MPQKTFIEDLTDFRKKFEKLNKAGLVNNELADSFNKLQNSAAAFIKDVNNRTAPPVPPSTVELPWTDKAFVDKWNEWKKHRKDEHNFVYAPNGEQKTLDRLVKITDDDMGRAIEAIDFSIPHKWKGIYEENKNPKKTKQVAEPESLNDINHDN